MHARTHTPEWLKDWLRHNRVPGFQDALGGVINTPFLKHKSWGNTSLDWQTLSQKIKWNQKDFRLLLKFSHLISSVFPSTKSNHTLWADKGEFLCTKSDKRRRKESQEIPWLSLQSDTQECTHSLPVFASYTGIAVSTASLRKYCGNHSMQRHQQRENSTRKHQHLCMQDDEKPQKCSLIYNAYENRICLITVSINFTLISEI